MREEATIVKPLRQQPYGNWEFEVKDPNGYVLVFSEINRASVTLVKLTSTTEYRGTESLDRSDGFHKRSGVERVEDFFSLHPAAARHRHAILQIVHRLHRVRIS